MDFENPKSGTLQTTLTTSAVPILLRLLKSPIPDTQLEIAWTDLVEADFPGYMPIGLATLDEAEDTMAGLGEVVSEQLVFVAGAIVNAQAIYGYAITRLNASGGHDLLDINEFGDIIVVDTVKQEIPLQIRAFAADDPSVA